MNVNQLHPSKYVQASDLHGQDARLQIARLAIEKVGDDQEELPVLYFSNASKGFVLNKTNATSIAAMYGDETDLWLGQVITIYPTRTQFGAKMVDCIRVRDGAPQPAFAPQPAPVYQHPGQPISAQQMQPPPLPPTAFNPPPQAQPGIPGPIPF